MRATVATTGLGVAVMALLSMADTAGAQSCLDRTVTIADLAAEMNRCNPAKLPALCSVNPPVNPQFIHKQVAAYDGADIPRWLERGPAGKLYTAKQQEKLFARTERLANANRPRLAKLFDIQFFRKAYGAPGEYQIGANITYTRCPPIVQPASCPRNTVTYFDLLPELNRVYHCNVPAFCSGAGGPIGFVREQMAGYGDSSLWLATHPDSDNSYNETRQDSIIARVKNFANTKRPDRVVVYITPFFIYDIEFFQDFVVPNTASYSYFLGANITYARCQFNASPD